MCTSGVVNMLFCVEILMYQISHSFMPVCIYIMPVILYLLISSFARTSC